MSFLGKDYRSLLKDIKKSGDTHILLDCKTESIADILKQALQVILMTSNNTKITSTSFFLLLF